MLTTLKRLAAPSAALVILLAGCDSDDSSPHGPGPITRIQAPSWMAIEPTQCLTNPWEEDWLAQPGNTYVDYPKDYATPGLDPGEIAIIKDYYLRHGVVVVETATTMRFEVVCLACSCPEGHTMYLLVRARDVATMLSLGYRRESPR
jgi:hypothetical protein